LQLAWEEASEAENWQRAVAVRQRQAALAPQDSLRRLAVARAMRRAGMLEAARREAESLVGDPLAGVEAQVLLAELGTSQGDFLLAAEIYQRLAENAAGSDAARGYWERAARMAELGGDSARAVASLDQALRGLELRESEQRLLDRMHAFQAGEFRHPADASEVIRGHQDPEMRLLAAKYLASKGGEEAFYALCDGLDDIDTRVPLLALEALASVDDPFVLSAVEDAMDHPDRSVRLAAVRCFGGLAERGGALQVVQRLDPEDRALFRAQCQILERLTGHIEPAPFDADLDARSALADAWREWWQQHS
jgi:tetratricopeptide (TPR) repeat protein